MIVSIAYKRERLHKNHQSKFFEQKENSVTTHLWNSQAFAIEICKAEEDHHLKI